MTVTHAIGLALEALASLPATLAGRLVAHRPQPDALDRLRERYASAEAHNDRNLT